MQVSVEASELSLREPSGICPLGHVAWAARHVTGAAVTSWLSCSRAAKAGQEQQEAAGIRRH